MQLNPDLISNVSIENNTTTDDKLVVFHLGPLLMKHFHEKDDKEIPYSKEYREFKLEKFNEFWKYPLLIEFFVFFGVFGYNCFFNSDIFEAVFITFLINMLLFIPSLLFVPILEAKDDFLQVLDASKFKAISFLKDLGIDIKRDLKGQNTKITSLIIWLKGLDKNLELPEDFSSALNEFETLYNSSGNTPWYYGRGHYNERGDLSNRLLLLVGALGVSFTDSYNNDPSFKYKEIVDSVYTPVDKSGDNKRTAEQVAKSNELLLSLIANNQNKQ